MARLLIPALIAIVSACACGGTSIGDGTAGAGGDGQPMLTTGDDDTVGGSLSNPPPISAGASTGGVPGVVDLPAGCPKEQPSAGSPCGVVKGSINYCKYSYSAACSQPTIATCEANGTWSVTAPEAGCGGATSELPLTCPITPPPDGTVCYLPGNLASYECRYEGGPCGGDVLSTCNGIWFSYAISDACGGEGGGL